tara:strand:- start:1754 stop:2725 length:972 start_codon:yes stop_codon:yes gene_type:complete
VDELNEAQAPQGQGDLADLVDIGNQSLDAIAAQQQYAEEPQGDEPSFDDQPDVEPSFAPTHASFSALDDALSDIEELEHDGFYEKIDESHLKDLPPVARRILHNFRVDRKQQQGRHTTQMQELMTKVEQRERSLSQSERDFAKRQSEFASLVDDPEVQKLLAEPEGQLPDVFTEQGVEARIQRGIAKGMQAVLEPMKAAADVKARENSYLEFLDGHPEMRDSNFKKEVAGLVRQRGDSGIPVSTQDAYQLVKARRVMAQQQARVVEQQRARQQSARRIGRAVSGGNPSNGDIPADVKKQGAPAILQWLQANPEAARKLSRSHR